MYRAPCEDDSDSDIEATDVAATCPEGRSPWVQQPAPAQVLTRQHSPCSPFLKRTRSTSSCGTPRAGTKPGVLGFGSNLNPSAGSSGPVPATVAAARAAAGTQAGLRVSPAQTAKRILGLLREQPAAGRSGSCSNAQGSGSVDGIRSAQPCITTTAQQQQCPVPPPATAAPAAAAVAAAAAAALTGNQRGPEPSTLQHLHQWAAVLQGTEHAPASGQTGGSLAATAAAGSKRRCPDGFAAGTTAAGVAGKGGLERSASDLNVEAAAGSAACSVSGSSSAAAAAGSADVAGFAAADDGGQPSAPPLAFLFSWAACRAPATPPLQPGDASVHAQPAAAGAAATVAAAAPPLYGNTQQCSPHQQQQRQQEMEGSDARPAQSQKTCWQQEQQQQRQQQDRQRVQQDAAAGNNSNCGSKRQHSGAADAGRAAAADVEQQDWHWPTSAKRRAAAAEPAADTMASGSSGKQEQQQERMSRSIDPAVAAAVAAASAATAAAANTLQGLKRAASPLEADPTSPSSAAKRLHDAGNSSNVQAAAAAAQVAGDAAAAAAGAAGDDVQGDEAMPQAASVTHKRQQPGAGSKDSEEQQQQPHAGKMPRHNGSAAAAGGPVPMDSEGPNNLQQQCSTPAAAAAAAPGSNSCSDAVLLALQQLYPPLSAVLCAVRAGGLSAVLAGPYGAAVSAIMARPAGQQLLMAFAELAADEVLLGQAVQAAQRKQQQDCQCADGMGSPAAAGCAGSSPCGFAAGGLFAGSTAWSAGSTGSAGAAAGGSGFPTPTIAVQLALQNLHSSIASSQQAAAQQLLASLSLAFELHQLGAEALDAAVRTRVLQLAQQQQLAQDLQGKLLLAEHQIQQEVQQRLAHEAAAAAAQQGLQAMQDKLEQVTMCQICFERPRDTVLMPCMHFLYCANCIRQGTNAAAAGRAADVLRCPVCRVPVSGQVVVHLTPTS